MSNNIAFREYWLHVFKNTHEGNINTWDYQWTYAMWKNKALAILPRVNLISNIGFDSQATHTTTINWTANLPTYELRLQTLPPKIAADTRLDLYTSEKVFAIPTSWAWYLRKARSTLKLRTRLRNFLRFKSANRKNKDAIQ
jgi:hypothetical protein